MPTSHSRPSKRTWRCRCFGCYYCARSSTRSPFDLLFKPYTLPFNYLYTLIHALTHTPAPLAVPVWSVYFDYVCGILCGGFNKQNQRLSPNTNQTELCVRSSTTQSKYFNNDFFHTHARTIRALCERQRRNVMRLMNVFARSESVLSRNAFNSALNIIFALVMCAHVCVCLFVCRTFRLVSCLLFVSHPRRSCASTEQESESVSLCVPP